MPPCSTEVISDVAFLKNKFKSLQQEILLFLRAEKLGNLYASGDFALMYVNQDRLSRRTVATL